MEYKGKLYAKVNGKYIECTETTQQLESRIKELENNTTESLKSLPNSFGIVMYICSECTTEIYEHHNFCPNCGRRIVR